MFIVYWSDCREESSEEEDDEDDDDEDEEEEEEEMEAESDRDSKRALSPITEQEEASKAATKEAEKPAEPTASTSAAETKPAEPVLQEKQQAAVAALTEREKGAFDVLMGMKTSPTTESAPAASTKKPSGSGPSSEDGDVNVEDDEEPSLPMDSRLEKDAVLALLQMHEPAKTTGEEYIMKDTELNFKPKHPVDAARQRQLEKAIYTTAAEHNYFAPRPPEGLPDEAEQTDSASEGEPSYVPTLPRQIQLDHNYCMPYMVEEPTKEKIKEREARISVSEPKDEVDLMEMDTVAVKVEEPVLEAPPVPEVKPAKQKKAPGRKKGKLADVTNLQKGSRELANLLQPVKKRIKPTFSIRNLQEEMKTAYDFLIRGIDEEDAGYLKRRYEELLQEDSVQTYWLNDTHWVDHTHTLIPDPTPPRKKRKKDKEDDLPKIHSTGQLRYINGLTPLLLDKMVTILADHIFICIFLNEKFCILIKISLKFVPQGPLHNNPALV